MSDSEFFRDLKDKEAKKFEATVERIARERYELLRKKAEEELRENPATKIVSVNVSRCKNKDDCTNTMEQDVYFKVSRMVGQYIMYRDIVKKEDCSHYEKKPNSLGLMSLNIGNKCETYYEQIYTANWTYPRDSSDY